MATRLAKLAEIVTPSEYGHKACWLSWLAHEGYAVPEAIFLPATDSSPDEFVSECLGDLNIQQILGQFRSGDRYAIAIRSSATCEDSQAESFAGHFQTVIGLMTLAEVLDGIRSVIASRDQAPAETSCRMGVILQSLIDALISGVAFSSNPVTGSKTESVISVIRGPGSRLVSGHASSEEITLSKSTYEPVQSPTTQGLQNRHVKEIGAISARIESRLGFPVDIEWCVDTATAHLYVLQCRPATGIFHRGRSLIHVSLAEQGQIPIHVARNKKVELRLLAEKAGVPISNAHLVFINCREMESQLPPMFRISTTEHSRGFSAVLIYPEKVAGKIIRHFADDQSLSTTLGDISRVVAPFYWSCVVILQEIYDPEYTGIAKRLRETLLIDISRGHFVPKGVVPASEYVLNLNGQVLHSTEPILDRYFRILNGSIIEEHVTEPGTLLVVPAPMLASIAQTLAPFLADEHSTVEFGLLARKDATPLIYLIDVVTEDVDAFPDTQMVSDGVISRGSITGRLVRFKAPRALTDSLDIHFHDSLACEADNDLPEVFLCELPDIALLDVIRTHDPKKLGFVFKDGSILCHLAIVLRERGIPAIRAQNYDHLVEGQIVLVDAETPDCKKADRVRSI